MLGVKALKPLLICLNLAYSTTFTCGPLALELPTSMSPGHFALSPWLLRNPGLDEQLEHPHLSKIYTF